MSGSGTRRVAPGELLDIAAYEQLRGRFLARIVELKRVRRVALGPNLTLLFENHDTALFQIQEMLRVERITKPTAIQHELDTYNELVPDERELSASAFLEYPDNAERDRMLVELAGVEDCFFVTAGGDRCAAPGAPRGERRDRTTAVHYLRFPLTERAAAAIRGREKVRAGVAHPKLQLEVELPPEAVASLAGDFED